MSRAGLNHIWAVLLASVLVVLAIGWVAYDQFLHRHFQAGPQAVRVEHPETVRMRMIAWNDAKKVFPEDLNSAWREAGGQFQWFDLPSICVIRDDLPEPNPETRVPGFYFDHAKDVRFQDLPKPDKAFFLCLDEATDEEWKQLAAFPNLVGIEMHHSDISEVGLEHVCKARNLRAFAGRRLNLTDKAVEHLASCKEMTHLCIWDSSFRDKLSQKRFSQFEKLECLTLSFNDPHVDTEAFPTFKRLKYLDISLSRFERPSLEDLEGLANLEHLDLSHSDDFGNDFAPLGRLQQLRKLNLASVNIDKAARTVVGSLKNLRSLDLNDTHLTIVPLPEIAKLQNLEELDLGNNKISDRTVQSLTPLRNLRKLNLSNTPIMNEAVPFLLDFPKLEELNVARTDIRSSGMSKLKRIPSLKKLNR